MYKPKNGKEIICKNGKWKNNSLNGYEIYYKEDGITISSKTYWVNGNIKGFDSYEEVTNNRLRFHF